MTRPLTALLLAVSLSGVLAGLVAVGQGCWENEG